MVASDGIVAALTVDQVIIATAVSNVVAITARDRILPEAAVQ